MVCLNDDFKCRFQKSWACLHEMNSEFDDCYGPEDWTENTNNDQVCCTANEIIDCFRIKTEMWCGRQSSQIMEELADNVILTTVPVDCKNHKTTKLRKQIHTSHPRNFPYKKTVNGCSVQSIDIFIIILGLVYLQCSYKSFISSIIKII